MMSRCNTPSREECVIIDSLPWEARQLLFECDGPGWTTSRSAAVRPPRRKMDSYVRGWIPADYTQILDKVASILGIDEWSFSAGELKEDGVPLPNTKYFVCFEGNGPSISAYGATSREAVLKCYALAWKKVNGKAGQVE